MLDTPRLSNPMVALIDEIIRLHGRLRSTFAGTKNSVGLATMEITVLASIVEAPVAPTVPQIGRSLGHPRQVIQRAANALVSAGLIETAPNPHHKRAPLLLPTARGRSLKREADTHAIEAANNLLRSLDAEKCRRLADELHELRHEIEAYLRAQKTE